MMKKSKLVARLSAGVLALLLGICCFTTACLPTPLLGEAGAASPEADEWIDPSPTDSYDFPGRVERTIEFGDEFTQMIIGADVVIPQGAAFETADVAPRLLDEGALAQITDVLTQGQSLGADGSVTLPSGGNMRLLAEVQGDPVGPPQLIINFYEADVSLPVLTTLSESQATDRAMAYIADMGLDLPFVGLSLRVDDDGQPVNYTAIFGSGLTGMPSTLSRYMGGIPDDVRLARQEEAILTFNDEDILSFSWYAPLEEVEGSRQTVTPLTMEALLAKVPEAFRQTAFLSDEEIKTWSLGGQGQIVYRIDRIQLGYMTDPTLPPGTDRYIPVWHFIGEMYIHYPNGAADRVLDENNELHFNASSRPEAFLILNALDGSFVLS